MIFTKSLLFFQNKLFVSNKRLYPLSKNLIVKKNSLCIKIRSLKQTHYVVHEFYFQFSFATNEQV